MGTWRSKELTQVMFFWGSTKGEAVTSEGRPGAQGPLQMEQPKAVQKFTGGKEMILLTWERPVFWEKQRGLGGGGLK